MRSLCALLAFCGGLTAVSVAEAQPPRLRPVAASAYTGGSTSTTNDASSDGDGCCDDCACDDCTSSGRCGRGGRCGHKGNRDAQKWFNCNCNGSYKFPVPPLYTYHWPGLYSMQRMTDYHSPWRFPAIKPYVDETPVKDLSSREPYRQVSATIAADAPPRFAAEETSDSGEPELLSAKIRRHYAE